MSEGRGRGSGPRAQELYRSLERPGANPLKDAQEKIDQAVRDAYGMSKRDDPLDFLFELNAEVASREDAMQPVVGPGLPPCVKEPSEFVSDDVLSVETEAWAKAGR